MFKVNVTMIKRKQFNNRKSALQRQFKFGDGNILVLEKSVVTA